MRDGEFDQGKIGEIPGGLSRREFMQFCTGIAATMGLSSAAGVKIAEAASNQAMRPPVIWISGQECTGCTETLLRPRHPTLEALILDTISLEYNEALCTGAGHQAEAHKNAMMKEHHGKYLLVIEGAIPTKEGGIYCQIAGRPFIDHVKEAAEGAAAIIAIGSCASWGGVPATPPNPTGAVGAPQVLTDKTVVTIPGCPPNPYNFLGTVLHFVTFGKLPALDGKNRPKFAYGRLIHENCERRPHFDSGRFALEFGDEGHKNGYCLYKIGCKGPETYANCPIQDFNEVSNTWPVGTGHPCIGCTEEGIVFTKPIHSLAEFKTITPPTAFPRIVEEKGKGLTAGSAALVAGVAGAAVGAGAMIAKNLGKDSGSDEGQGEG